MLVFCCLFLSLQVYYFISVTRFSSVCNKYIFNHKSKNILYFGLTLEMLTSLEIT